MLDVILLDLVKDYTMLCVTRTLSHKPGTLDQALNPDSVSTSVRDEEALARLMPRS